jgi:hypothetical protein
MRLPVIEESLHVTKSTASLVALLATGVLSPPIAAVAEPFAYPPKPVAWVVGPGYFGFSGIPWPGPPFAWPIRTPSYGCYVSRVDLKGARRRVEVCS